MESISLRLPPGVFISTTIAAAFCLCAVETTRDMRVAEPASMGRLKSTMTTVFPDATGCVDTGEAKPVNCLPQTKRTLKQSSPKLMWQRKRFLLTSSIFYHSWLFSGLPVSFGTNKNKLLFH